jgi:hypothetical protein
MIPIISQQKLCDSGRTHTLHTIPHPESYHNENVRLTDRKIPALQGKEESRERISSSQRGEGQIILASHRHLVPHLTNGDPQGAIDERMDR